ncbi:hypothetical protein [Shewanella colwelliana]|uniref:hypothetical protein n=1 Tax=Shewanella colwelliana TaxID=23 RepID=UPI00373697A4
MNLWLKGFAYYLFGNKNKTKMCRISFALRYFVLFCGGMLRKVVNCCFAVSFGGWLGCGFVFLVGLPCSKYISNVI